MEKEYTEEDVQRFLLSMIKDLYDKEEVIMPPFPIHDYVADWWKENKPIFDV